jgi:LuxR family maltose regulon positive regulatory protein
VGRGFDDASLAAVDTRRLPATSFMPPRLPPDVVDRQRLESRIDGDASIRLTLVVRPPGAGKTTLLACWTRRVERPAAWLTVDADIAESSRFWAALVRAIGTSRPDMVLNAPDVVDADRPHGASVARALVDDFAGAHDRPHAVVIDDAHLLSAATWDELAWLVEHQPPNLHLVVLSRADPPFSLARWRARGWLSEIRAQDLAFDLDEAVELFERFPAEAARTPGLAPELWKRTEGWAAGLRLALLAIRDGADPSGLIRQFSGMHASVSELLVAEVLDRQPADIREFLRRTSILGTLEPRVCDHLTGRSDSRAILRRLAGDQIYITPIDDRPDQFRYHPLLAELLHYELRTFDGALEPELHRRASCFYADEGRTAEAVDHALAGHDYEAAVALIAERMPTLYAEGRRYQVGAWLDAVPDEFLSAQPERVVAHCAALLFLGRVEWVRWLHHGYATVGDDRPDLRSRLVLFEAIGHATQGRLERFLELHRLSTALRGGGVADPFDEFATAWYARLLSVDGRHDEAVAEATALLNHPRTAMTPAAATSLMAGVVFRSGDHAHGGALADEAIELWRTMGEPDLIGMADALSVRADVCRAAGDLAEAEAMAETALSLCGAPPAHLLTIRAERSRAALEADPARAKQRLDEVAERCRRFGSDERLVRLVTAPLEDPAGSGPTPDRPTTVARGTWPPLAPAPPHGVVEPLTDRELAVLRLLQSNLSAPEIGRELNISRHTVKTHVVHIYRKLAVGSRSEAVREARRLGILGSGPAGARAAI